MKKLMNRIIFISPAHFYDSLESNVSAVSFNLTAEVKSYALQDFYFQCSSAFIVSG
jgi:hypothetical protein